MVLIELIAAVAVFTMVLGIVFASFIAGSRMFYHATLRQGLQGDARRISSKLRKDMAMTDFNTVGILERSYASPEGPLRRDAICMAALHNWSNVNDPVNFQSGLTLPRWNRYVVIYPTMEEKARLFRTEVIPPAVPAEGFTGPYSEMGLNLNDDPSLNSHIEEWGMLSDQIRSFEVSRNLSEYTVTLGCTLRGEGKKKAHSEEVVEETLEFEVLIKTKNTWPDL